MKPRLAPFALLAVLAALLAGCGGGGGSATGGDSAAGIVPASAAIFVSIDTNLRSTQVKRLDAALKKFPIRDRLLSELRKSITSGGTDLNGLIKWGGPQVDVVVLDAQRGTAVGLTKPKDEKMFERALSSGDTKLVYQRMHGWTAFSDDKAALDEVKHADEKLGDDETFTNATANLPDDALAKAYVAGPAVKQSVASLGTGATTSLTGQRPRWLSAAALAHDNGVELQLYVNGKGVAGGPNFKASLADDVPAGVLAALSFNDLGGGLKSLQSSGVPGVPQLEQALGVRMSEIGEVLSGEGIVYVRAGNPIPEVTLVTRQSDEEHAKRTVGAVLRKLAPNAKTSPAEVDGVKLTAVDFGPVSIFYGTFDGKLIVTDFDNAVRDLRGGGKKLSDDKTFKDATGAVGLPAETNGWLYVDLKDTVPVVDALAELAGARIPAVVDDNLQPLRSFVAYGSRDRDTETLKLFLQTS